MLTLASIILSVMSADVPDRSEGMSPVVVVRDSSFYRPTERTGMVVAPPEKVSELAWGQAIDPKRPEDILMDSPYFQSKEVR